MVPHTQTTLEEVTISNHAVTTNTTHSSENTFQTHHTLPLPQTRRYCGTPSTRRTPWRRVRMLMVSRWSKASIEPRSINEQASHTTPTSHTVHLHFISALPTSGYRTGAGQALGRAPSDSNPAKQNADWTNAADQVRSVASTVQLYTVADECSLADRSTRGQGRA